VIAAAVTLNSPGPAVTRQGRTGLDGRTFEMPTFRTATSRGRRTDGPHATPVRRPAAAPPLSRRTAAVGQYRAWRDVAGRPAPTATGEDRATAAGRARLGPRPGITGPRQISGRSGLPWEEMAVLDLRSVEQHWLGLDLPILARTLPAGRHAARAAVHVRPAPAVRLA
jgi:lipopolysaccharide/colanic/teichoic acid biosynthesis glycosyltransferase